MWRSVINERPAPLSEEFLQRFDSDPCHAAAGCEVQWSKNLRQEPWYQQLLKVTFKDGVWTGDDARFAAMITDGVSPEIVASRDYPSTYEQFRHYYELAEDVLRQDGIGLLDHRFDDTDNLSIYTLRDWWGKNHILIYCVPRYVPTYEDVITNVLAEFQTSSQPPLLAIAIVLMLRNVGCFDIWSGDDKKLIRAINKVFPLKNSLSRSVKRVLAHQFDCSVTEAEFHLRALLVFKYGHDRMCFEDNMENNHRILRKYGIRIERGEEEAAWWEYDFIERRKVPNYYTRECWKITSPFRSSSLLDHVSDELSDFCDDDS